MQVLSLRAWEAGIHTVMVAGHQMVAFSCESTQMVTVTMGSDFRFVGAGGGAVWLGARCGAVGEEAGDGSVVVF